VGTVVDMKKLEQSQGAKVEVISTDPAVIRDVLERLPDDLRTDGGERAKP
jgi:TusA-related sulfurtransferase